ncbi:MAG TPA: flagellar hook protein FlgE [Acidisarcina sp.]|nr:flagellar hook protein FlgE [Acidisarcina sp.]
MPSFSIPLTGLEADSTALNTIANNLSNMNTTAYKAQSASFSDLFYQQIGSAGSGDPLQQGAGTQIASISSNFTSGSTNSTGKATDVALNGNGFFVVQGNGGPEYTRAGNFQLDSSGNLITQAGQRVMGYPAAGGVVNTNAPLRAINIPVGQVEQPKATSLMSMTANLDASAAAGTQVPGQITLYDSLGVSHLATVTFTKSAAAANQWGYQVSLPAADLPPAAATTIASGSLTFDSQGALKTVSDSAGTQIAPVTAGGVTTYPPVSISSVPLADSAAPLSFNWQLFDSNSVGTITQVAAASGVAKTTQDGYMSGQYQSFSIDSKGVLSATFDNGQQSVIGQLAVASVANEQGLSRIGENSFAATSASGQPSVGVAGAAGRGTIQGGALEASNVDISTEFSNLIIAQRAFEANSKAITTFDTVTQQTINMIR